jgi:hypothetical protein
MGFSFARREPAYSRHSDWERLGSFVPAADWKALHIRRRPANLVSGYRLWHLTVASQWLNQGRWVLQTGHREVDQPDESPRLYGHTDQDDLLRQTLQAEQEVRAISMPHPFVRVVITLRLPSDTFHPFGDSGHLLRSRNGD